MRLPSTTAAAPTSPAQAVVINAPATKSEMAARRRRVTRNMRSNSFDGALGLWVILRWIISGVLPRLPARILLGRDWEVSGGIRGAKLRPRRANPRSEEHTSELQSRGHLVCRLLLEKKKR